MCFFPPLKNPLLLSKYMNQGGMTCVMARIIPPSRKSEGDRVNPGMGLRLLEAAEVGPEAEIPNHIEGGVVEPGPHIKGHPSVVRIPLQPPNQKIDVLAEDGLLGAHGALPEAVCRLSPEHTVVPSARGDDSIRGVLAHRPVKMVVLGHFLRCVVTMNILPSPRIGER